MSALARAILGAHAALALAAWWLLPAGFRLDHVRFVPNEVAPPLLLALALAGLASRAQAPSLVAFAGTWCGGALAGAIAFPRSGRSPAIVGIAITATLVSVATRVLARELPDPARRRARKKLLAPIFAAGALLGGGIVVAQRAPAPDTRPVGDGPRPGARTEPAYAPPEVAVAPGVTLAPNTGAVQVRAGALELELFPLLELDRRSPDRCWVVLAPREPARAWQPVRWWARAPRGGAEYRAGDEHASLSVAALDSRTVVVEAWARLPRPVFTHLNAFARFAVSAQAVELAFSSCPDAAIAVKPFDYPAGRPQRLAWFDGEALHVAEATSGEKGPFHELARGPLRRDEPLAIEVRESGVALVRVVLEDWARQAGTALSPTAGWGLPVNAIEFFLAPDGRTHVIAALAATSVGRGWDSVGHAAGDYRSRVRIERLR